MKTALVTGGAGFIGSHIAERLIKEKYRVIIFDNLSSGFKSYLRSQALFVKGDVRKKKDVESLFAKHKINVVFHIAGQASNISSFTDPFFDIEENLVGTMNVVLSSIKNRAPRFLYASSMTVYGHPNRLPVSESQACKPVSYYGISKYSAERFVHATASRSDLKFKFHVTSFRMFNVYGPRQSLTNPYQGAMAIFLGNVMRKETIKIFGDGKQSRDFIYIDDIVNAWMLALNNSKSYNQIYNLGYGERITLNELISTIIKSLGGNPKTYPVKHLPTRPGDQRHMQADISLARRHLGFNPKISLTVGLKQTIAWVNNPDNINL